MQLPLTGIVGERLNDSDGKSVFSTIELKDLVSLVACVLLLPVENFLDRRMPDDCDSLVVIEKPLDYVWNGIEIYFACWKTLQRRCQIVVFGGHENVRYALACRVIQNTNHH